MTPKDNVDPKRLTAVPCWRHYGGFVFAGILATLTDATILTGITQLTGQSPFLVRPIGIATGMVVSWLVNRTITFGVRNRPTVSEFLQFAAVSWSAQVLNYAAFVIILAALPRTIPLAALFVASLIAMVVSYLGFRHLVFRGS